MNNEAINLLNTVEVLGGEMEHDEPIYDNVIDYMVLVDYISDEFAEELKEFAKQPYSGTYDILRDIIEQQMDILLKGSA